MPRNNPIEARETGSSSANEYSRGMKAHQASAVEMSVAITPPERPPIQELKKTAGKKRNHAKGLIAAQKIDCRANATRGSSMARISRLSAIGFMVAEAPWPGTAAG